MKFRYLLLTTIAFCLLILWNVDRGTYENQHSEQTPVSGKYSGPAQFQLFHKGIRTPEGIEEPQYMPGYLLKELERAKLNAYSKNPEARTDENIIWTERGPANVPGRTRGLAVMPNDPTKNTWLAGSSGGGIWKTTNGGLTWQNKSQDFPTLAVATLAVCTSNPNIVYAGTGEYIASAGTAIVGNGIFKSTDGGESWTQLFSTTNNQDFISVTRVIVDPNNPDLVLACSAPNTWGDFHSSIMRSMDGGISWSKVFDVTQGGAIEQLIATPGNFNILYAAQNSVGVLKSTNAGVSWNLSNSGMDPSGRVELAVSPVNSNRIFASAEGGLSGTGSDLYLSEDGGTSWEIVEVSFNNASVDFLGGQGWYDNTIACDPINADRVYFGGVGLFRTQLESGSSSINSYSGQEDGTNFMSLIDFNGNIYGGRIRTGNSASSSIEVRFGPGQMQKAHRFLVPIGSTSGVPDDNYSFVDYIDVPFEVWKIDENGNDIQQLMVSFRDQDRNGEFNLKLFNTEGSAEEQSREYVFINDVPYNPNSPLPGMATNGGQVFNQMYFFWPVLSAGNTWVPENLPPSEFRILFGSISVLNATTVTVADVYSSYDGKNSFNVFGVDVHPDQHNMVMIPMSGSTFKMLVSNDGGMFISNTSGTPGISEGDWTMVGKTYNTSQFYGADKRPGFDQYIGGMQDNGTWKSPPNENSSASTNYLFNIGGDGFEVIWNSLDDQKLIGGSQGNNFEKSINGGATWTSATAGLTGDQPFISKLANSKDNPDVLFTASSAGVFRSTNFGTSWQLTPITQKWTASTFLDVEVSKANANIIWAGSGMTASRNIHVSTDGGQSFELTNNFDQVSLGSISKLASHPFEKNTAYALFSFSGRPKILRTTDLGQTWNDISGFGANSTSSNGFPDVAVYCLYVRPDNPEIIWAGTEIGIVESSDNGLTWSIIDDFPNVSVWDMKGQDNQVVIATHGRGIWTATLENSQSNYVNIPEVIAGGTSPAKDLMLRIVNNVEFDSLQIYISNQKAGSVKNLASGQFDIAISGVTPGVKEIKLIAFIEDAPFQSSTYQVEHLNLLTVEDSYGTYFNTLNDLAVTGLTLQNFSGSESGERKTLQTPHPYNTTTLYRALLLHPVKVSSTHPMLYFSSIAITEPGKDTVLVEATKNGLDWIRLSTTIDASSNNQWFEAFTDNETGQKIMFDLREIDLSTKFDAEDSIIVRLSMHSGPAITGWGWALNYITIQQEPTATENPLQKGEPLALFPNPSTGNFTVEFNITRATEVRAEVIDLFGRVVASNVSQKEIGTQQATFNLSNQPQGSYLVVLRTNTGNMVGKISIKR